MEQQWSDQQRKYCVKRLRRDLLNQYFFYSVLFDFTEYFILLFLLIKED